jgi:predicted nucleic acid-binding Zn ribbon protein
MASRGPKAMSDVLAELMARRGFARIQGAANYEAAWREAAGELAAKYTRVGNLRRGKLEVLVANSTLVQELTFQKIQLLETLEKLLPGEGIKDLRFRVGPVQ